MGMQKTFARLFRWQGGWVAVIAAIALAWIGLEAISTAEEVFAGRQAKWFLAGLPVLLFCLLVPVNRVGRASYVLYAIVIGMLVFIVLPGVPRTLVPVKNGARSWIDLGVFNIQPTELAKITTVLILAWTLRYRDQHRKLHGLIVPFLLMALPVLLILMQPDLGSAMVFAPTFLVILIAAGARARHLASMLLLAVVAILINVAIVLMLPESVQLLKEHQRTRITAMVSLANEDRRFDRSTNYQQIQALTVAGSGGVQGYGRQRSSIVVRQNRLPLDYNDMIFAVVVNRWGLPGGLAVLGLLLAMVLGMLRVASQTKDPFGRLVTVGFASMLFSQAMINIAISVGLLPVTGITLPLVSYGGSSLISTYVMIGLVVSVGAARPRMLAWPSFEYDRK